MTCCAAVAALDDLRPAALDQHERGRRVAFAHDVGTVGMVDEVRAGGQRGQVVGAAAPEDGAAAQQGLGPRLLLHGGVGGGHGDV